MKVSLLLGFFTMTALGWEVHPERKLQIEEINKKATTWKAGLNARFAGLAPGASKYMNGAKLAEIKMAIQVALMKGEMEIYNPKNPSASIPVSFVSAENWPACEKVINDIRDQSNCGCCWAFGGATSASDRLCIATNGTTMLPLSAQDVCFNSNRDGCDGGEITTPWTYLRSTGVVSGGQYNNTGPFGAGYCSDYSLPHCHHHGPQGDDPYPAEGTDGCPSESSPDGPTACDDDADTNHNDFATDKYTVSKVQTASGEESIQRMIMEGGPVETAFTVYSDFEDYVSGIYQHTSGSYAGGHAVTFTGWGVENGTKYWIVQNSWNEYWGEAGSFRIIRGENHCGIEAQVTGSASDATWAKAGIKLN
mmetsp:Transcript_12387/g.16690  ORF Transcript_12387/g.16690 Transcript_12387/m.16690 type:complete len:364 (+) Transcript_12387:98-1189(+)